MKIMILCEACNKYKTIEARTVGKVINMDAIPVNLNIEWGIGNIGDLEEMTDISESDVEVTNLSIRFTCQSCNDDFITIEQ